MTRRWILTLLAGSLLALGSLRAAPPAPLVAAPPEPLRVLAAASLSEVLPAVARAWREEGGAEVRFTFDGTSRLAAQLAAAAPADLFFSADTRWMDDVAARGLVRPTSRTDLLGNRLVVVVPAAASARPSSPAELATLDGRLALAGENVPAGRYAREALAHAGVWDSLAPRIVGGDNVRTVLAWVARAEAAAGVVYATDARVEPRVAVAFTFAEGSHPPVVYPAAITTSSTQAEAAGRLLAYCSGPGRVVFEAAGFTVLTAPRP